MVLSPQSRRRQHFVYFFPLPQGHGSLRPIFFSFRIGSWRATMLFCCVAGTIEVADIVDRLYRLEVNEESDEECIGCLIQFGVLLQRFGCPVEDAIPAIRFRFCDASIGIDDRTGLPGRRVGIVQYLIEDLGQVCTKMREDPGELFGSQVIPAVVITPRMKTAPLLCLNIAGTDTQEDS